MACSKYQSDFGEIISKEEQRKILKERYQAFAGARWPSFEDFLLDKIKDENREDIKKYSLFTLRDFAIRKDLHPVPTEHLLYLQKIYPDIKLSEETKKWVNEYKLFDQFDSHQPKIRL